MVEFISQKGSPIALAPAPAKKYRGVRLPGAELYQAVADEYKIYIHEYPQKLFTLSLVTIHCEAAQEFRVRESNECLRFEAVQAGKLVIRTHDGPPLTISAGQYRLSDNRAFKMSFKERTGCVCFVARLSEEFLAQQAVGESITQGGVRNIASPVQNLIDLILSNPYSETLRDGLYDTNMRQILFYHAAIPEQALPGDLSRSDFAKIQEADRIIALNLNHHYSIPVLAKLVQSNTHFIKEGFYKAFGMGPYERLKHFRMERARFLLESTNEQIQIVSEMAGYETPGGFLHAFRDKFGMTAMEWRKKSRGLNSTEEKDNEGSKS